MSFYGNQIIETSKAFSNIVVQPTTLEDNYVTLTPQVQESNLLIIPKDPWIAFKADPFNKSIYIYHTTTNQRLLNTTNIDLPNEWLNKILHNDNFLTDYVQTPGNTNENPIQLGPGSVFATIAKIDDTQDIVIDNAGHLLNSKIVYYKFPTIGEFKYNKDPWVQTLYGTDQWYIDNKNSLNIDPNNIGYIPDLYQKMNTVFNTISNLSNDPDENLQFSMSDLLTLQSNIELLKAQVSNLYNPDFNITRNVNGITVNPSNLSKALISIRDCQMGERDQNGQLIESGKYIDTAVIQILNGIKDCAYDREFVENSRINGGYGVPSSLKEEVPLLQLIEKLISLKDIIEGFFGLDYSLPENPNGYIETTVSEVEFNADPSLYYIFENSVFTVQTNETYLADQKYYTKITKNLIQIEIDSDIFNANRQNLYFKPIKTASPIGEYYNQVHDTDEWRGNEQYFLYTGYTKESCERILNAIECYSSGGVTETITAYIQKLNSAR